MAKTVKTPAIVSSSSAGKHRYAGLRRKARSGEARLAKREHALTAQIEAGLFHKALKTCRQILRIQPDSIDHQRVQGQILLALEDYTAALALLEHVPACQLEIAYCCYKLGQVSRTADLLQHGEDSLDEGKARGLRLLEAQVRYKQGDYREALKLYEDLLESSDPASPEHEDIQNNLQACQSRLAFASSLPDHIANMSTPVEMLEATPIQSLIAQHPRYRPTQAPASIISLNAETNSQSSKLSKQPAVVKTPKLPAHIAALPPAERPAPDPERWLPKRERSTWQDNRAKREKERGKIKKKTASQAGLTQGSSASAPAAKPVNSANAKKKGSKGKRK
ncbi:uncharacterized protein L969DRAFT_90375 [Mixia osmundae IAM 14324]|uniref:Signal recognition particle subunit SRP72 n=1 Tax=Mixia osmundae (strain CBS 9802 / IAM 14324 / JCM 22182 / KY 12970) TaxID=764103 RepID=G7E2A7_MIXOS|nr:uncharacterized protein L969DRAFT_90375 [Mixia osmundae IAM 14324]KEI36840.1 hypothetical protein L969DRAFT_90375 [Mixia osmundae IAM 14324]GAA96967.1 hypothetical protein E5Q_03641 [Mixia osmundae IAM 14324]